MKKTAVFPGSFDPFTKGHEAVVKKGARLFDEIIIAVGVNESKVSFFNLEKRLNHIKALFADLPAIKVVTYNSLTVDLCKEQNADFILRGLRDTRDFEYEKSIAFLNEQLGGIETVFLLTELKYAPINSTIVREISKNNGDISHFVTLSEKLV